MVAFQLQTLYIINVLYEEIMTSDLRQNIVSSIKSQFKVKSIILFGSHAWGNPTVDSDIDLLVVLDEKGFAKSYTERLKKKVAIARVLEGIDRQYGLDILVYTVNEWELLLREGSFFTKTIAVKGVALA